MKNSLFLAALPLEVFGFLALLDFVQHLRNTYTYTLTPQLCPSTCGQCGPLETGHGKQLRMRGPQTCRLRECDARQATMPASGADPRASIRHRPGSQAAVTLTRHSILESGNEVCQVGKGLNGEPTV